MFRSIEPSLVLPDQATQVQNGARNGAYDPHACKHGSVVIIPEAAACCYAQIAV